MKRYIFLFFFSLLFFTIGYAQLTIGSIKNPEKAAILDLKTDVSAAAVAENESSDKGFILPRVSLTNLNTLDPFIPSASAKENKEHVGLMVYNLNTTSPFLKGVYIWDGVKWEYNQQQKELPVFGATNGINKTATALRLGGTLIENTTIDQAGHNISFNQTSGTFSVNSNNLAIKNTNAGIGAIPSLTTKLTVGGETTINGDLNVASSTSSFKKTTITDTLYYKDASVLDPKGYVLKSLDATGKASWVDVNTIPGITASSYIEGTFTGTGLNIPVSSWNSTTNYPINTAKITLPKGLWLVYLSLVVEPATPVNASAEAIWGRFTLRENSSPTPGTGTTGYNQIELGPSTRFYRIGALNISDRVYPNVKKNVIKGYMIIRIVDTTRSLYVWLNNRSTASGYASWASSVGSVKIGDSNDPQNYMVAFPL